MPPKRPRSSPNTHDGESKRKTPRTESTKAGPSSHPLYDIKNGQSLIVKLKKTGGLIRDHIAKKILSEKCVTDNIVELKGTISKKIRTVLHYNPNAKVGKMALNLDEQTKEQWHRTISKIDYKTIECKLKERDLSYLRHEIAFDQQDSSKSLKQLARLVVTSFNTVKEALVLERIIYFDCLFEKSLQTLLHFGDGQLESCLQNLVSDGLLQVESVDGSDDKFYFISYQNLFNLVRLNLDEMRLENKQTSMEVWIGKFQPIYRLLKKIEQKIEDLKPVRRILKPQPANPKRFQRDDSGYLTIKPKNYDASPKEDDELNGSGLEGMAVGMPTKKTSRKEPLDWIEEITVVVEDNAVSPTSAANGMPGPEHDDEQRRISHGDFLSPASTDGESASMPPNMTLTENSSYTFTSTTSFCLDFYFEVMQNTAQGCSVSMLEKAWQEDSALTLKLIFQLRDIRRGKAAKLQFYHCLSWLYKNHFRTLLKNLEHLPLHGYWKDLLWLVLFTMTGQVVLVTKQQVGAEKKETEEQQIDYETVALEEVIRKISNLTKKDEKFSLLYKAVVRIFTKALKHDVEVLNRKENLESIALAGKWAPSIDGSFDLSTQLGRSIARSLFREKTAGETAEDYDKKAFSSYQSKYLGPLRDKIDIVEKRMSKRKWSEINYERVPSVAMKRCKKIFLARDEEHFTGFLEAVKKGEKKIASGALLPHEIVNELMKGGEIAKELEDVSEMQWKSYVDNLKKVGMLESALAVCDVSGSINGDPMMNVAIALSLLIADLSKPPFDGLVRSFSPGPQLYAVKQQSLKEKVEFTRRMVGGMSTNLMAVFNLILNKAIADKLKPSKMVKTIFIFSDMEFDECGGQHYETDYMLIQRKFVGAGYPLPGVVFWNLRGGDRSKPVTKQEKNVTMVSGFSGQMLRTFLENGKFNSPYESMLDTLGKHYDHLEVVD